jgi:hypothetical protein
MRASRVLASPGVWVIIVGVAAVLALILRADLPYRKPANDTHRPGRRG